MLHVLQKQVVLWGRISAVRTFSVTKQQFSASSNSEDSPENNKKGGFFSKIKQDFIDDFKKKEGGKEVLDNVEKTADQYRNFMKKNIFDRLPKPKPKEESAEPMIDKDKLYKNIEGFKEQIQQRSSDFLLKSKTSLTERFKKEPKPENEESVNEEPKPSKIKSLFEQSGIKETEYYQNISSKVSEFSKSTKDSVTQSDSLKEAVKFRERFKEDLMTRSKELGKKVDEVSEDLDKLRQDAVKTKQDIESSEAFKKVSDATVETLKSATEDIFDSTKLRESETYKSPEQLKKRIEDDEMVKVSEKPEIKIDEETLGVTTHKGSNWENQWKNFKENNPLIDKFLEYRTKMEESDNIFMRAGYTMVDSVSGIFRGMVQPHDISLTVAEINKIEPTFSLPKFGSRLRFDIVPNVLEAYLRADLEVLENWCHERAYGQFKQLIETRKDLGAARLIDIGDCDVVAGKMLEQGPVFMFNVQTQQLFTHAKKVSNGDTVEVVDEDQIKMIVYTFAVCRDQSLLDPTAAWLVLEVMEHVTAENYM